MRFPPRVAAVIGGLAAAWIAACTPSMSPGPGAAGVRIPDKEDKTMSSQGLPDRETIVSEVAPGLVAGLAADEAAQARALLGTLVTDWLREAGGDRDAADILEALRSDFADAVKDLPPDGRLRHVRKEAVERRIRAAQIESFDLGKRIVDGLVDDATARRDGAALQARADAIAAEVKLLGDEPDVRPLRRDLENVLLEALFAVDRKVMSFRLNRYQQDRQAAVGAGN